MKYGKSICIHFFLLVWGLPIYAQGNEGATEQLWLYIPDILVGSFTGQAQLATDCPVAKPFVF